MTAGPLRRGVKDGWEDRLIYLTVDLSAKGTASEILNDFWIH
jgi:hypothetical protein